MNVNRRTQVDRSAATRTALIDAARPLFAEHGFGGVGTETIVRAAGVTRGALYHQFADKTELFAAVFEAVEEDIGGRIDALVTESGSTDPIERHAHRRRRLAGGLRRARGPADRAAGRARRAGLGALARDRDALRHGPGRGGAEPRRWRWAAYAASRVRPLAHVLVGAMDEAALYVARAEDPVAAGERGARRWSTS